MAATIIITSPEDEVSWKVASQILEHLLADSFDPIVTRYITFLNYSYG